MADRNTPSQARLRTMAEIADLAGVSKSTVSRALNGSPLISEETRVRIRAIAETHNYVINEGARQFRRQRTQTLSVVASFDPDKRQHAYDPFFHDLLGAISDAAAREGYDVLLARLPVAEQRWERKFLDASHSDGLILIGQQGERDELNLLAEMGTPLVVWGAALPGHDYCTVGSDNRAGGYLAARHLLDQGRRRLVFLGDPGLPELSLRYQGFLEAHRDVGLIHDERLVLPTDFLLQDAGETIERLMGTGVGFDGVFANSDIIGIAAIKALKRQGLSVPEDVAVVGYDDVPLAEIYEPSLSSIRQNVHLGGQTLVELVLAQLAGEVPERVVLPTELVVRASSAS